MKYVAAAIIVLGLIGCGEKYTDQGKLLSQAIAIDLKRKGLYKKDQDFTSKMEINVGHGDQIRYSIYDVKDKDFLAAYVGFVVAHGIEVTGGIPISIAVYPKSSSEYTNKVFNAKKAILKIEVRS